MARSWAALSVAGLLAVGSGCGSATSSHRPAIRIVHWSVHGSTAILDVKINGWKMAPPRRGPVPKPNTGQWHIFAVDGYAGFPYEPQCGMIDGVAGASDEIAVAVSGSGY